jgi:TolA-binding protein
MEKKELIQRLQEFINYNNVNGLYDFINENYILTIDNLNDEIEDLNDEIEELNDEIKDLNNDKEILSLKIEDLLPFEIDSMSIIDELKIERILNNWNNARF